MSLHFWGGGRHTHGWSAHTPLAWGWPLLAQAQAQAQSQFRAPKGAIQAQLAAPQLDRSDRKSQLKRCARRQEVSQFFARQLFRPASCSLLPATPTPLRFCSANIFPRHDDDDWLEVSLRGDSNKSLKGFHFGASKSCYMQSRRACSWFEYEMVFWSGFWPPAAAVRAEFEFLNPVRGVLTPR